MIVYRIEMANGRGPYTYPFRDCLEAHTNFYGYHQSPSSDYIDNEKTISLFDLVHKTQECLSSYYFALRNEKLFLKWFSKEELHNMAEISEKESIPIYYCEYEVDKKYTISSKIQTVFLKKYSKLKKRIPLGEYINA